MRFDLAQLAANTGNLNAAIYDAGSYLRLFYQTGDDGEGGPRRHVLPARHRPLPPRLPLRHLVGRHGRVHQPVDLPAHPGRRARHEDPVRPREVLRLRRLQDRDHRPAGAGAQRPAARTRSRPCASARRTTASSAARRRSAREPPLRRRRRLLPAGQVRPRGRARQVRLHLRRLGARRRAPRTCPCRSRSTSSSTETTRTSRSSSSSPRSTTRTSSPGASAPRLDVLQQHLKDFDVAGATKDQTGVARRRAGRRQARAICASARRASTAI